uniref:Pleckstrin isogenyy domain-containing family M member 3 n=1 Tax=Cajanus cajan TaxID=3821 RepID=A0A151S9R6_CAJCA|nr:Pleckstrin isogenyy domain-containing family M member 3 [Cajanus cajan]
MNGRGELGSPDPCDSFPPLRVRRSDAAASRHSSCGGDSEFERYCSANSVMGTPSTSMSLCSAVTLFHDFSDLDFDNFSLGKGAQPEPNRNRSRTFRYGSSGLEFYGDCSDELAITALDSSESIAFNRNEESEVNVGEGGVKEEKREEEEEGEEEEEDDEEEEFSEGDDSMYNYGSDDDGRNETSLSNIIHYREEPEVRNDNSLFMNSSVAYGSMDLDDFLLQNGPVSVVSDLFRNQRKMNDGVNSGSGQKEGAKDDKDNVTVNEVEETKELGCSDGIEEVRDREVDMLANLGESSTSIDFGNSFEKHVQGSDDLVSCSKTASVANVDEVDLDLVAEEATRNTSLNVSGGGSMEKGNVNVNSIEAIAISDAQCVKLEVDDSMFKLDRNNDSRIDETSSNPSNSLHLGNVDAKSFESPEKSAPPLDSGTRKTLESSSTSTDLFEERPVVSMIEDFELNEFYDEVVQEMEEILLESVDSPGARLSMGNRLADRQFSMPSRDGGLTASTSSTDDAYLLVQRPRRIDRIEVVGARQKKGDVSFSERLVGVKEYTVYKIKVWSGKDQWEVERRYRDFLTLYRCMKTLFNEQGWKLPLPWASVEKETQIFRSASPDIIVKRSVLIQECLQSILSFRFSLSPPRALNWFLSPMLCVTAVNPFLLSKVPALLHVMSIRKKISTMLPYVRCPFWRSINRGLGSRRYLLESNDFFALRDLIDLSKGVFAALPVMVETLSRKILEHITDQCLICCDVGVPCNARQDCSDPSSLIFPFQEDDIERCKACELVFHKRCFRKVANCPCGAQLKLNETRSLTNRGGETRGGLDLLGRGGLSPRFLSGLFAKEKPNKTREQHKDENIILMGSLPTTSL